MNDIAVFMQIDQTEERIDCYFFDQPQGHALVLEFVMLNHIKQIGSQNLKDRAVVLAVDAMVGEVVDEQKRAAQLGIDVFRMQLLYF